MLCIYRQMEKNGREMNYMKDKVFLDSNILVYCSDGNDIQKQNMARTLIESLVRKNKGQISTQTLQEFFHVVTRKLKNSKEDTKKDVEKYAKIFRRPQRQWK